MMFVKSWLASRAMATALREFPDRLLISRELTENKDRYSLVLRDT